MTASPDPRKVTYLPLASLTPDPRNPKAHDQDTIDASIGRFGVLDLIVKDERTGHIISGHGRRSALLSMEARGETPPEGVRIDEDGVWLVPVVTGWASRTDSEAAAALIALNRTTELGGWVDDALLDLLDELSEVEGGFEGVGFTEDDLEALQHLTYEVEDGPRDLDDLHAEVGDVLPEDSLQRVVLKVDAATAGELNTRLGSSSELHARAAEILLAELPE